jgi:hypothetical protein
LKRKKKQPVPANSRREVQLIPPTSDAARDEGPRLIPLDDHAKEASRLEHYLDLADRALGAKRSPKTK